jgi:uncharacterized protein (TIGR00299 family) protein
VSTRVGWLDCASGVSGDMLLGALSMLGAVEVEQLARSMNLDVTVETTRAQRSGLEGVRVDVRPATDQPHRRLPDVVAIVRDCEVEPAVADRAVAVFDRLARAEASVHGVGPDQVEFHEVGAVDAIVDVVGACVGLAALGLDRLVVSPVALGGGSARTRHGVVPVPAPAVLALLADAGLPAYGGPAPVELATPTGVALLAEFATAAGPMPAMTVDAVGVGAGARELDGRANVLRLVVGSAVADAGRDGWQVLEANIDDLDPRLWPVVIERVLLAGAADAWLTPIVMKKGRAAHTLAVLTTDAAADDVTRAVFAESSTIGLRSTRVDKRELEREWVSVDVDGQQVRVKVARLGGDVVNVAPEFDDVSRAAAALDRPVKAVLFAATAAAHVRLS